MANLWYPDQETRQSISRGNNKVRLNSLKITGDLAEVNCPHCNKEMLYNSVTCKYLSESGANHACKGMGEL